MVNEVNMVVEDDEDEDDVDFNPTWRGEYPSEASSGLSSDNEVLGEEVGEVLSNSSKHHNDGSSPMVPGRNLDSGTEDEENVMNNRLADEVVSEKDTILENSDAKELNSSVQQEEEIACPEASNSKVLSEDESDAAEELTKEEFLGQATNSSSPISFKKPIIEIDDEDAICKRTRARHSLADYTLEELEVFLQESDDDDDLQNVDEEEEYRKFLAAVLLEGDDIGQSGQDDENLDDDDEENDADFAIEIEEALESDVDESFEDERRPSDKNEEDSHRPETRQKKRLRESTEKKKCFIGPERMPLRPILPYVSNGQVAPVPALGLRFSSPESYSSSSFALSGLDLAHGFTLQQLGQLYCLVHEHVQLLIQIFSISVLDSSRQQVAIKVQELIMEMIVRQEEAFTWRKVPYDMSCFQSPNLHASLQIDSSESSEFSRWVPLIDRPIHSILDVAPLRTIKSYMADVSATVLKFRQSHVEDPVDKSHLKREPLFPFPVLASQTRTDEILSGDLNALSARINSPVSPGQLPPKKSLAATLVENTKKQTVALVPVDIAKLAQRFYPLFNVALFPHKPPIQAVANRVLFTDAEDGLLAVGLMKYNNDWEAIQKHFLPCKSKHQIFVRQKNRSSSKAPDNPIKTVRRMKTSPLTADEKARIYEGLKLFKQDWLSVWKIFVPHRDPSLLPRQWRIATGTQKSYKKSEAIKEKRRLYEARRRRLKASISDGNTLFEKEVDNDGDNSGEDMDYVNEAYVHEAFLADSETGTSNNISYEISLSGIGNSDIQFNNIQAQKDRVHELNTSIKPTTIKNPLSLCTDIRYTSLNALQSNCHSSISNLGTPRSHLGSIPVPTRKSKGARVVKLAPGLPPINLPPSVRVISQSAIQNHPNGSSHSYMGRNVTKSYSKSPGVANGEGKLTMPGENSSTNGLEANQYQDGTISDQYVTEENASQSDLHMHPLLFHASENQISSYYSINKYHGAPSTFLLGSELQKESMFSKSQHLVTGKDNNSGIQNHRETPLDLFSVEFHPLLQRTDNASADFGMLSSVDRISGGLAASHHDKLPNESHCSVRENLSGNDQLSAGGSTPCHYEKGSKLDLDIHLYSVTEKEKTRKARDDNIHQYDESGSTRMHPTMVDKCMDADMSIHVCNRKSSECAASDDMVADSKGCCSEDANALEVVQMSDVCSSQCRKNYEEANLDIIMEQEELSDSDDESANVEFEREEIDDSEDDETEYSRPREAVNKELPTCSAARDNCHDCFNFSHSRESISTRRESVDEDNNLPSPGWSCQNLFNTKLSQLKPKHENAKRDISSRSSLSVVQSLPGQLSKARNPKSSKMQLLGAMQHPMRPDNECKTVASRRPRKRSACK
ncbi:hypothetical protein Cni_G17902 [Canna indica]|uniref:Homeodomain-like superfamily protein n=1 Tax=Canna indica TaxID=4628 RepID=A0AAQ3QFK4_9LILI|nr:hypothetical protein Cni_G17902 [Canna indica]